MNFQHKGFEFRTTHMHSNSYCISLIGSGGVWFQVKADLIMHVIPIAKKVINKVFEHGKPKFWPIPGRKFVVTGQMFNEHTGELEDDTDLNWFNDYRPARKPVEPGEVLTLAGSVTGFDDWYRDDGKERHPEYYWLYSDGSPRETFRGAPAWAYLLRGQIKAL